MKFFRKHYKGIIFGIFVFLVLSATLPLLVVDKYEDYIYPDLESVEYSDVVIVFGAGVKKNGEPSDSLKDRLITAATLYDSGLVSKILVSGDNRFENYNEPEAMRDYLVNEHNIPIDDIVLDYAGRRTFDTCIRAKEIFHVEAAILVTQEYHLPRALFSCNALGVESKGVSATRQEYVFGAYYKLREIAAKYKAFIDVYIWEPSYIGGDAEPIEF